MKVFYDIENKSPSVSQSSPNTYIFNYPCNSTTSCYPYNVLIHPGKYIFRLWGAQGGDGRYQNNHTVRTDSGGKCAFVSGKISIKQTTRLYLYIGGKGEDQTDYDTSNPGKGGYNGGGDGGKDLLDSLSGESSAGGGGATDIRLIPHSVSEIESLKSRIIVAAGGGGACSSNQEFCHRNDNLTNSILCSSIDTSLNEN